MFLVQLYSNLYRVHETTRQLCVKASTNSLSLHLINTNVLVRHAFSLIPVEKRLVAEHRLEEELNKATEAAPGTASPEEEE